MLRRSLNTRERGDFGPIQQAGCYGMLACLLALLLLVMAAGAYTLSTGEPLQLPIVEIGIVWGVVLAVSEFMAFGWMTMGRLLLIGFIGGAVGALLANVVWGSPVSCHERDRTGANKPKEQASG